MSVNVVKELGYSSLWGHSGTWCDYVKERVTVPDMGDLSCKASNSDLKNLQTTVEYKIEDLKIEAEKNIENISLSFNAKVEELKNIIQSDERLREEEKALRNIEDEIVENIKNEYSYLQDSIHKEVEAFQQVDLQTELQSVVSPVQNAIENIEKNLEKINPAEIERLIYILSEIKKEKAEVDAKREDISRMTNKTINKLSDIENDNFYIRIFLAILTIIVGVLGVTVIGYN